MDELSTILGVFSLAFGLVVVGWPRFPLRNHPKLTDNELESINSGLKGIRRMYSVFNLVTVFATGFILFLIYKSNQVFWEERIVVLFVLSFAVFALSDALFALRTKVFPMATKYNWNSYVYDGNEELRWVAFWQVGLSIFLIVIDCVILISTL